MNEKPLWSAVALDADAEPVRILDLDVARTTWSRVHESMRVVHLRLSRQPDPQWIRFFHEERESRINPRRAGIWVEDGCIAFDCLLPDVESHHLPDIRRSVEFANERMLQLVAARIRERGAQQVADRGERLELEQLRQRVRELVDPRAVPPTPVAPPAGPSTAAPAAGVERRGGDRRASPAAPAAPATPATPVAPGAEATAEAPAMPVAPQAAAAPPAAPAATPPRSLDASLDEYRAALREARERARDTSKKTP